jgi:hypothetical protein
MNLSMPGKRIWNATEVDHLFTVEDDTRQVAAIGTVAGTNTDMTRITGTKGTQVVDIGKSTDQAAGMIVKVVTVVT